jgi:hypothetical protein
MPDPRRVTVELSDFLRDQSAVAMKGLVSGPIAWRADRLIEAVPRKYGTVGYGELVSALLHGTDRDPAALALLIENYREDRVWATRQPFERSLDRSGRWEIELRPPGGQRLG